MPLILETFSKLYLNAFSTDFQESSLSSEDLTFFLHSHIQKPVPLFSSFHILIFGILPL